MNVEQKVRSAMRALWVVRWVRNRLGDAAMVFIVIWLYSLVGIGEKVPLIAALMLATLEFYSRDVLLQCIERVERLAPNTQWQQQAPRLTRLLRVEARYHARALWSTDVVHPLRIMIGLTLGVIAIEVLPGAAGNAILLAIAAYSFLALNVAAVRGLLGRWRYASAVKRLSCRLAPSEQ